MKVDFVLMTPTAKAPIKKLKDNFCYDVFADSIEELAPNVYKYHTNVGYQIDREGEERFDDFILDIDGRCRSSVWETGMVLSNCIATVDENYIGEVSFVFYHVFPNMPKYEVGDRIAQINIGFTLPIDFRQVGELKPTDRGDKGYGSSGRK